MTDKPLPFAHSFNTTKNIKIHLDCTLSPDDFFFHQIILCKFKIKGSKEILDSVTAVNVEKFANADGLAAKAGVLTDGLVELVACKLIFT